MKNDVENVGVEATVVIATVDQLKELVLNEEVSREDVFKSVEDFLSQAEQAHADELKKRDDEISELKKTEAPSSAKRKVDSKGQVKIKILFPVSGKFFLPYNVGQVVKLDEKVADELVESRYAEYA